MVIKAQKKELKFCKIFVLERKNKNFANRSSVLVWLYFNIFLVTSQSYDSHTFLVTVILGNDALFKCTVPSFLSEFLIISGWFDSEGNELGTHNGNSLHAHPSPRSSRFKSHDIVFSFSVTAQRYEVDILRESVIVGNDALFKCSIPSFVSDFVSVPSWEDSEGTSFSSGAWGNFTVMEYVLKRWKLFH